MTQPRLYIFDFDGTLTRGDTFLPFARLALGKRRLMLTLLRMLPCMIMMKLHLIDNGKVKERMWCRLFSGMPYHALEPAAEQFAQSHAHLWRQDALALLHTLRQEQAEVAVVTASLGCWVRPFVHRQYPQATVIATECQVNADGILTGLFSTPNCYGQQKVHRLKAAYPHLEDYYTIAYGDSKGDKPLLAHAKEKHYRTLR